MPNIALYITLLISFYHPIGVLENNAYILCRLCYLILCRLCYLLQRLQSLNILSLESHRIELDMITVYELFHGLMGITPEQAGLHMSSNNVRSGVMRLEQPFARTVRMQSLFTFRVPSLWNSLPSYITRSASLVAFKNKLRDWLLNVDSIVFKQ